MIVLPVPILLCGSFFSLPAWGWDVFGKIGFLGEPPCGSCVLLGDSDMELRLMDDVEPQGVEASMFGKPCVLV